MIRTTPPNLLTPPREEEEAYPYRRVWPSIIVEATAIIFLAFGLFIIYNFIGLGVPAFFRSTANIAIALFPAIIWSISSLWRERTVTAPRTELGSTFVLALLAANAIGMPVLDRIRPDEWLSLAGTIDRILGYAFTTGTVQESIKYGVLWFYLSRSSLRTRHDSLAYAVSVSVAFVTVDSLSRPDLSNISSDIFAATVFHTYVIHLCATSIISYGLAELRFSGRSLLLLPLTFLVSIILVGVTLSLRSSFVNADFLLGNSFPNFLFGLIFSLIVLIAVMVSIAFIFNAADRREREAYVAGDIQA